MVLYNEVKQLFGDGLDQQAAQNLTRMGIKSLLGSQDALDILGDPKDKFITQQDQLYMATLESAAIVGSVEGISLDFKPILIRPGKDDHVGHLTQVHNPDMQGLIERIQASEVSSEKLNDLTEEELETRTNLILRLGAHALHAQQHHEQLLRFGKKRDDVNRLREETNNLLQTSEALMNNLELNLRAIQAKREEKELRLRNIAPENEAEKMKIEAQLLELEAKRETDRGKLSLANKIADQRQQQHIDKQVSKARDRELKREIANQQSALKQQEVLVTRESNLLGSQVSNTGE